MNATDISWCEYTWNIRHGCSAVSDGWRNCYAERISRQYGHTDHPWTPEHAEDDIYEQRRIRELPAPVPAVQRARRALCGAPVGTHGGDR